jgi:hypothetical protein
MQKTKYYELSKPDYTDVADIADINTNMDTIDEKLNTALTHTHALTDSAITGVLSIAKGGTGSSTASAARTALGLGTAAEKSVATSIAQNGTGLVDSGTVYTALSKKSDTSHGHALTDSTVTGVLSIEKGGTGSSTAATARTALGLGTASTYGVSTSVSSGSSNLVTSSAVYSAISNIKVNNRTHIVIATYDTKNPLKSNADYTCTSTNASTILKTAINAVAKGGRIELLDGTYQLQYDEDAIEISKAITIVGCGHSTVIKQPSDTSAGEARSIFEITGSDVHIKNMMISDANVTSAVTMIKQQSDTVTYDNLFFIFNGSDDSCTNSCIEGSKVCNYTRIQNCRVYKGFSDSTKVMFDFSGCTSFIGVICGNLSSGYGNISVKFANETHKNNTAIFGHTNIDVTIK